MKTETEKWTHKPDLSKDDDGHQWRVWNTERRAPYTNDSFVQAWRSERGQLWICNSGEGPFGSGRSAYPDGEIDAAVCSRIGRQGGLAAVEFRRPDMPSYDDTVKTIEAYTVNLEGVWRHGTLLDGQPFTRLDRPAVLALARRLQLTTVPKWTREPDEVKDSGRAYEFKWRLDERCYVEAWTCNFEVWYVQPHNRRLPDSHTPETIDAAVVELLKEAP